MSVLYRTKNVRVKVSKAEHDGSLLNMYPKDWMGSKDSRFVDGDLIIEFEDKISFVIHPEFGKRLLERVEDD
jgi:hypothetical protein